VRKLLISICLIPLISQAEVIFVGPYLGATLDSRINTLQVNNWTNNVFGAGSSGTLNGTAGTQTIPKFDAGYSFVTSALTRLGVGMNFDLNSTKVLKDPNKAFLNGTNALTSKSAFSIYAEPGYLIHNDTLVYGKVGYSSFRLVDSNAALAITNQKYKGTDLGFGVKTKINDNWSLFTEFEKISYSSKSDSAVNGIGSSPVSKITPTASSGSIGISYQF